MPEQESYQPSPEEIEQAESHLTDKEKEMTEKRELQPNPESFEMLALECEQVRTLAEAYSQKTREPVVVLCNGSAGTIYHIGIDSISTQFNRQMTSRIPKGQDKESFLRAQREEFAKDWQKHLQETRESWPKGLPLTKSRKVALIKTAKEWMDAGRLDFLAIPEIDVKIGSRFPFPTEESEKTLKALSTVADRFLYIYLDWSDFGGYRFPDSFGSGNTKLMGRKGISWAYIRNQENDILHVNAIGEDKQTRVSSNHEWLDAILTQVVAKVEKKDLLFSPMHNPGIDDEKRFKNWESRINWLKDWPAGVSYDRASIIKGKYRPDVSADRRLNLFSEESDDTETRIERYNKAMRDAVHSIRELQVDENGDNYFQRQRRHRIEGVGGKA